MTGLLCRLCMASSSSVCEVCRWRAQSAGEEKVSLQMSQTSCAYWLRPSAVVAADADAPDPTETGVAGPDTEPEQEPDIDADPGRPADPGVAGMPGVSAFARSLEVLAETADRADRSESCCGHSAELGNSDSDSFK